MSRIFALVLVAACGPAATTPKPPTAPPGPVDPLEAVADRIAMEAIDGHATAGATIAISRHGKLVVAKGYGYADIVGTVRADDRTIYRIGSLTKQFTAAAIMLLVEQGKLALDDDVTKYVAVPTGGFTITIRQLLNHTSGIPNYTELPDFPTWAATHVTPAAIVARIAKMSWGSPPGTEFRYSNTGYAVLGMVIEKLSGMTYADFIAKQVVARAGLTSIRYCDESRPDPHRAKGYDPKDGKLTLAEPIDMTTPFAAGALCSTAPDLIAWSAALGSGKVVSPASYAQMTTPPSVADKPSEYGMGLVVATFEGHRTIWHNGGINGFISELHGYPDDEVTIAVLTNSAGDAASHIELALARAALGIVTKTFPLPDELRDAIVGKYDTPGLGEVALVIEGGKPTIVPPGQRHFALEYTGGETFAITEVGAKLTFHREGGVVTNMTVEQGGHSVDAKRIP